MNKTNNTTANEVTKKYTLIVQYDPKCDKVVRATVEENKIPHSVITNYFFTIPNITMEEVEKYKEMLRPCAVNRTDGTRLYRIRFGAWKYKETVIKEEKTPHSHTNNTPDVAAAAKKDRKEKKTLTKFQKNEHKDDKKKPTAENPIPIYGRNAKKLAYRHGKNKFKNTTKVAPAIVESTLEKKTRQRAQKACRYITKQTTLKDFRMHANKPKTAPKKPVQTEMALAA